MHVPLQSQNLRPFPQLHRSSLRQNLQRKLPRQTASSHGRHAARSSASRLRAACARPGLRLLCGPQPTGRQKVDCHVQVGDAPARPAEVQRRQLQLQCGRNPVFTVSTGRLVQRDNDGGKAPSPRCIPVPSPKTCNTTHQSKVRIGSQLRHNLAARYRVSWGAGSMSQPKVTVLCEAREGEQCEHHHEAQVISRRKRSGACMQRQAVATCFWQWLTKKE